MSRFDCDVLVVGAGPAGASTAFQLARRGVKVRVLDRARFPRSKACAECLSPQAARLLDDMGVLAQVESHAARMNGIVVRAPDGSQALGDYRAGHGYRAYRDHGLSVRREILDATLVAAARDAGARVDESAQVTGVVRNERGSVLGVHVRRPGGGSEELAAPVVVGADGLRSLVSRRLGLSRAWRWPRRIAIVAHYRGTLGITDRVELHVEHDGFVGIADVGAGVTTVAAVFPRQRAREFTGDAAGFLARWLASKPHLAGRFAGATLDGAARVAGPFASHARRAWAPGAFLVGDAADFFDPFTGEGIYAGLRGGELLADHVVAALGSRPADAGRAYDDARRREFGGKWRVERLIGIGVASPVLMNRATRAMAVRKPLANLLAGVTGDFVPASEVLRPAFLVQLLLAARPGTDVARHESRGASQETPMATHAP